ncbi:MAG: ATP-binding cassette domain-containing protein [Gemmatimonadetes bacterium]|nr:ATP-binding cassette domain-containing protein [Gemmatimonadota bacterium]
MISVEGVTKRYGPITAVDRASFTVNRGEVVGFLGPNGAGKTTTMRMLTGTLQPDEGTIRFDGSRIGEDLTAAKSRVGYLPEANPLYDDMLVCEFLEYVARLRGMDGGAARPAIGRAGEETGLEEVFFRPISEISKGFRQRTGMAGAILHEPEILVLDEPTEGLDPNQRVEIRKLVNSLGSERTVILSTHVMQEVEATCDRLLIISRGAIAADGTVGELIEAGQGVSQYTVEAAGEGVADALAALPGVADHSVESAEGRMRVRLEAEGDRELRPEIFQLAKERDWVLWELRRERATLEQVFRELTLDAPQSVESSREEAE